MSQKVELLVNHFLSWLDLAIRTTIWKKEKKVCEVSRKKKMTSTYQICSTFKKHSIVVRVLKAQPGVGAILVSLPYNNVYLKCQIDVGILKKKL